MTTSNSQKQINFISKKTLIMNTKYPNKANFSHVFQIVSQRDKIDLMKKKTK